MLKIENIKYDYKETSSSCCYNFSLHVEKGEIVGIMGKSGSGKSTLLDLIAGFLTPKSGKILLKNQDLTNMEIEKRPLTILFQNYNTFEHLSVLENVLLGISVSLKPKKQEIIRAKEILKEVGLKEFENKPVSQLSGGQNQRVAIARSLLRDKPILLLDEPFSALDYDTKMKMLNLVKSITKTRELYTIMVTHDKLECEKIASKVYTLKDGKLSL